MKLARSLAVLAASTWILGLTTLGAASATTLAPSAPPNDSIDSAIRLGTPPARFIEDTSQATHHAADGQCVGNSSVWFRTRPTVTRTVRLSTVGSDYDTLLAVFSGPKPNRTRLACEDDSFADAFDGSNLASARKVRFVAGTTYWVAVSAYGARGGQLVLNTWLATDAGISATVESVETGMVSGQLLVTGTVQCTTPSVFEVQLVARQRVADGANVARGSDYIDSACDPANTTAWSLAIDSETGWAFQPGTVRLMQTALAFDRFSFAMDGPFANNFEVTANPNAVHTAR